MKVLRSSARISSIVFALLALGCNQSGTSLVRPPVAQQVPHISIHHGTTLSDPYHWLRQKDSLDVMRYLDQEHEYTRKVLRPVETLQATLVDEFQSRLPDKDEDVPHRIGNWLYFSRQVAELDYDQFLRKPVGSNDEQLLIDLNTIAPKSAFVALGETDISPDGNQLAYTLDLTGFRDYQLFVKDLISGVTSPELQKHVSSFAFAADNQTIFFVTENQAKRSTTLFRLDQGKPPVKLYEETDSLFDITVSRSLDDQWIVVSAGSYGSSNAWVIPANEPLTPMRAVTPRQPDVEAEFVGSRGNTLFVRTNDTGRDYRLVSIDINKPDQIVEHLPHRAGTFIESALVLKDYLVVLERDNGLPRISKLQSTGQLTPLIFSEPTFNVTLGSNNSFDADMLRIHFESLVTPLTTYDVNLADMSLNALKQSQVIGYDAGRYTQSRITIAARDGTPIPVSLLRPINASHSSPIFIDVYGAYGLPEWPWFDSAYLSLLDRGVSVAILHVRGGGEMGKRWHDQGRLMNKRNTFYDTIDAIEGLHKMGISSPEVTALSGASAGGLTLGAVLNQRPDLVRVALVGVPFVDVMQTMLDESLPLTTQEFNEWGNPIASKEAFEYMLGYSPIDNLKAQPYPAMMVYSSYNDSQVMYWEPTKYVAKLRTLNQSDRPLLLDMNMAGGHGGPSGRSDSFEQIAKQYAFVLWQLGVDGPRIPAHGPDGPILPPTDRLHIDVLR
jgi:oligopeptidase B